MRTSSDITVTDQFCGAGGSSQGATAAGARVVLAMNHWKLAVETHNTNFPDVLHDCVDISACDPRRYPRTTILIASPECTNHSIAKGQKRKQQAQPSLWEPYPKLDPAAERSRATMFDIPRFAEYHQYECIIVENVVEARDWLLFDEWLLMMQKLGYTWETVYFNSMFAHPTPQSRDRMYVVFWKKGNTAPNLRFTPTAWCVNAARMSLLSNPGKIRSRSRDATANSMSIVAPIVLVRSCPTTMQRQMRLTGTCLFNASANGTGHSSPRRYGVFRWALIASHLRQSSLNWPMVLQPVAWYDPLLHPIRRKRRRKVWDWSLHFSWASTIPMPLAIMPIRLHPPALLRRRDKIKPWSFPT